MNCPGLQAGLGIILHSDLAKISGFYWATAHVFLFINNPGLKAGVIEKKHKLFYEETHLVHIHFLICKLFFAVKYCTHAC